MTLYFWAHVPATHMLRCVQRSARRIGHTVPIHSSDAETTICHSRHGPRSASTAAQAQGGFDDDSIPGPEFRALDLSALPQEGDVLRKMYRARVTVRRVLDQGHDRPSSREQSLQGLIDKRIARLPRALLKDRSARESEILQSASTNASYLTARRDVEEILPKSPESHSQSKAAFRERYKPGRVNWLPHARRLVDIRSKQDELSTTSVEVSNTFLQKYTGSERPNMWIQRTGSGSEVRVLSTQAEGTAEGVRRMLLQGSLRAVELAKEDILKLQHDHEESGQLSTDSQQLVQATEDDYLTVESIASFTQYVYRVTNEDVPRHQEQSMGRSWHQIAAEKLVAVFTTPATSIHASTVALNRALAFLRTRTELLGTATVLYTKAKQMGLHMDCTSYNLLLAPALWRNDTDRVRQLTSEMKMTGTVPNSHTWSLFFRACRHPSERADMIDLMTEADVRLNPQAKAAMSTSLIRRNFYWMSDSSSEVHVLISLLDKTFGPEWLNAQSYSLMLNMCQRRNLRRQVLPVLETLAAVRFVSNGSSAAEAVFKIQLHKSMFDSVKWLGSSRSLTDRATRKRMVTDMFMRAWDTKHANICRVLWRYAATHGWLTWDMRNAVNEALLRNTTEQQDTNARRASRLMARIVAGLDLDIEGFRDGLPRLSQRFEGVTNPMLWLSEYVSDDGTRDEQLSLAYAVIGRDLSAHEKFKPMSKSTRNALLRTAVVKDAIWIRRRWWDSQTLAELLGESIRVPLQEQGAFHESKEVHEEATARSDAAFHRKRGYSALASARPKSKLIIRRTRPRPSDGHHETERLMAQIRWLRKERTPSVRFRKLEADKGGPVRSAKAEAPPTTRMKRTPSKRIRKLVALSVGDKKFAGGAVTFTEFMVDSHAPRMLMLKKVSRTPPGKHITEASKSTLHTLQTRRMSTLRTMNLRNDAHVTQRSEVNAPIESKQLAASKSRKNRELVFKKKTSDAPFTVRKFFKLDQPASEKSEDDILANTNRNSHDLQASPIKPGNSFRKTSTDDPFRLTKYHKRPYTITQYHSPSETLTQSQAEMWASLPTIMGEKERVIIQKYMSASVSISKRDRDILRQAMLASRRYEKMQEDADSPVIFKYGSTASTPVLRHVATAATDGKDDVNDNAGEDLYHEWRPSGTYGLQVPTDVQEGQQEKRDWRDVMVDLLEAQRKV